MTLFVAIPLVLTFYIAQTKFQIVGSPKWVGLQNYEALWTDPAFWKSAQNTLLFAVISVPLKLVIALGLALLLNRATALSGFYRTVFYLPFLMPAVAGSVVFMLLLTPNAGPVNIALEAMGLNPPDWLLDPKAALWTLILLSLWPLGVETLVFLGGLQNIPKDVSEAADLDSPKRWHKLVWVTLPLITPMVLFNLVIGIIYSFQVFTQAIVIGGTTGTPAEATLMYMVVLYRAAFRYFNMGLAAAMATVLFVVVLILTLLIFQTARSWVHYEGGER
ncbi:MAG: sugar ABC transporter permease [Rhodobacteraceae bacterium]|nr:sugar ABC transporter permease [Paracoccaceae bacterium]